MVRLAILPLSAGLMLALALVALAQPNSDGPTTYEVVINGEAFRVEGNRVTKLQSKEKPGTTYEIAIRVAPTQEVRLNTVQLEYDLPAKISDDRGKTQRSVQIKHELGFSVLVTDLGGRLEPKAQGEILKALADSLVATYREQGGKDVKATEPETRKFAGSSGRGCTIHYLDAKGFGHTCLAYVLSGEKFTVTCVAQFLDDDKADVGPLVRKIFDSLRSLP
jgi:hypothetical protein